MKRSKLFLVGYSLTIAVLLVGCDLFGNANAPSNLTASKGEGTSISLSWTAPKLSSEDTKTVSSYDVHRTDTVGVYANTSGTSYSDSIAAGNYATKYTYYVTANFSDSSTSGDSNSATGWCISSAKLSMGTSAGVYPATTSTGWFRTFVAKGWRYHLVTTNNLTIYDNDANSIISPTSSGSETVWTADRSGTVWVHDTTTNFATVSAWYE